MIVIATPVYFYKFYISTFYLQHIKSRAGSATIFSVATMTTPQRLLASMIYTKKLLCYNKPSVSNGDATTQKATRHQVKIVFLITLSRCRENCRICPALLKIFNCIIFHIYKYSFLAVGAL